MKRTIVLAPAALVLCVLMAAIETASAHTMYVNVTNHVPNVKRGATLYFGWGETIPVDDMLGADWLKSCQVMAPDGKLRPLERPAAFLTRVELEKEGTYVLAAELNPGFYTVYTEDGKKKHHLGPKTGLKNVETSIHYQQQGKAILNAGKLSDAFRQPVGHKLEIIPLKNPALLREGDTLPLKVLFDGKPVPGYPKLMATYMGFSTTGAFAYGASVVKGQAELKILRSGVWFVNVNYRTSPTGELAGKCDEASYTATLTFEAGRSPQAEE